jgi:hypothetical protein
MGRKWGQACMLTEQYCCQCPQEAPALSFHWEESAAREGPPRKKSIHTDVSTIGKASLLHFLQVPLPIDLALQCEDALRLLAADDFPYRKARLSYSRTLGCPVLDH